MHTYTSLRRRAVAYLTTSPPANPPKHKDYVASLDSRLAEPLNRTLLILSFALTLSYLAWRGLDVAGKLAIGICVGCLLPFAALCVAGALHLDIGRARAWRGDVDGVSLSCAVCLVQDLVFDGGMSTFNQPIHEPNAPHPPIYTQT